MKKASVLFLIATVLPQCGCASRIGGWGTNINRFETREEVRAEFGNPIKELLDNGVVTAEYRIHGKVADGVSEVTWGWIYVGTLMLADLAFVPVQVFDAAYYGIVGRKIVFHFDQNGKVKSWEASEILPLTNERRIRMMEKGSSSEQIQAEEK